MIWEKFRRKRKHIWHRGYCHASIYIKRTGWLLARPPAHCLKLHKPQTTLSQRKCTEVYFSQELTLAAQQAHQVALDNFPFHIGVLFYYSFANSADVSRVRKKIAWNLCCFIYTF